jgi:hypothetical protein
MSLCHVEGCSCVACAMTHKLPEHPLYLGDEDDDFDCAYAGWRNVIDCQALVELDETEAGNG